MKKNKKKSPPTPSKELNDWVRSLPLTLQLKLLYRALRGELDIESQNSLEQDFEQDFDQ